MKMDVIEETAADMHEEILNRDLAEATAFSAADSQLQKAGSMPTSSPGENN